MSPSRGDHSAKHGHILPRSPSSPNGSSSSLTIVPDPIIPFDPTAPPHFPSSPTSVSEKKSPPPPPSPNSADLPPGCSFAPAPTSPYPSAEDEDGRRPDPTATQLIYVDHPYLSPSDPFHFPALRKRGILYCAVFYTGMTAFSPSAYSIGSGSMTRDLGCSQLEVAAGLALYCWGFGIAPLVLAPLSEEFGRRWTYLIAVVIYTLCHLMMTLGKNTATILVCRLLVGLSGSLGATLVGGTISDIYAPADRGLPMAVFGFFAQFTTGMAPMIMAWVENSPRLGWRWIQWIQFILLVVYFPVAYFLLKETRSPVLLRRRAAKLRKERGLADGGRYTARSELDMPTMGQMMRTSMLRPLVFLAVEPTVTFFSLWLSLCWGVLYTQIYGLSYILKNIYGFDITDVGLAFASLCIGSLAGFLLNFVQHRIYQRKHPIKGVEARLYVPMVVGVIFPVASYIYAFTARPSIHWIVPLIALSFIFMCICTIYITTFVYLADCYGTYASSALAAQSFLRNLIAGAFCMFIQAMYDRLTPRWTISTFAVLATLLGAVPFVAFFKGPQIRARSMYSRQLMEMERKRVEAEEDAAAATYAGQGDVQNFDEKGR